MPNSNKNIKGLTERYLRGEISREEFEVMLEEFSSGNQEVEEVLQRHFEQVMEEHHPEQKPNRQLGSPWWAIAASVLLVLGVVTILILVTHQNAPEYITYDTAYGEQSDFLLEDSSHVYLNAGSTLAFEGFGSQKDREVTLSGEAFFDIARDESRPFIIHSGEMDIRVLGTAFNVEAYPEEDVIKVTVTEGIVAINNSNPDIEQKLTAGQSIVFNRANGNYEMESAQEILWKERILAFDKTPFDQVIRKMERWYGVDLEVMDSSLHQLTLNGRFANKDVHEMIRAIAFLANKEHTSNPQLIQVNPLPMKHHPSR
ncbi:FecR domain-containing protein [Echinicola rosea]|uniref:DUF4974 domain-containing protein n=1 Tax=Echinicola rosea TaxID=1807691 RepID=A0ABQ1VA72_9BACT|nr:FecR domain-containing protein [Echinicola rosea]GGF46266.1 hypothetical protein GCM10011339_38470 [Echinicola rosea]